METAPPDSRAAKDDEAPPRRIPICDAHHHFWDLSLGRNPWLLPDGVLPTFRYGDYSAIRRNYLFSDFQRDSGAFDVACSVHVETEPARDKAVEESAWLTKVNAECGLPSAIVCAAWLDAPEDEVDALLAAQTQYALVKAVRHKPTAAPSPDALRKQRESNAQPVAGSMSDPCWRRGYALLAKYGLSFDLQVHWWHLDEAAQLARDFPDTIIVLNHTGLPADRSEAGLAGWRAALETFAAEPNTYLKISGIGVPSVTPKWSVELNRRVVREALEAFGVHRCLIASNFPVDSLCGDYTTIIGGMCEILTDAGLDDAGLAAVLYENAMRVYRIDPDVNGASRRKGSKF